MKTIKITNVSLEEGNKFISSIQKIRHVRDAASNFIKSCATVALMVGSVSAISSTAQASDVTKDQMIAINKMNMAINHAFEYKTDQQLFGQKDKWQDVNQFFELGKGDCEDFAIAKYQHIKEISPDIEARIAYVKLQKTNGSFEAHMIAMYKNGDNWKILDNYTDLVLESSERVDLIPVYSVILHDDGKTELGLFNRSWDDKFIVQQPNPNIVHKIETAFKPPSKKTETAMKMFLNHHIAENKGLSGPN